MKTPQTKERISDRKPRSLRLPPELEKWLKHQAVDNARSLSGEINARLEESKRHQLEKETKGAQS